MKPDGRLVVIICEELAKAWGDELWEKEQTQVYWFKDMGHTHGWNEDAYGLSISCGPDSEMGEAGVSRVKIPWGSILFYEVHPNSDEYTTWSKVRRNGS